MSHIHTEPGQHDATACAFIVRTDLPEPAILLHKHRKLHKWLQFGGHVELNENPWQTVVREIREEAGYELSQLKLLQPDMPQAELDDAITRPFPFNLNTHRFGELDHFHDDIAYAFTTSESPRHRADDGESAEFRTFTRNELAALTNNEIPENVRGNALIVLDYFLDNWQQVTPPAA